MLYFLGVTTTLTDFTPPSPVYIASYLLPVYGSYIFSYKQTQM